MVTRLKVATPLRVRQLFVAIMLFAAARLILVASFHESGWSFLVTQWQDHTLRYVGLGHTPLGNKPPAEQAGYWLREVDRIVARYPDSAAMHMGAAWVLDSPDILFMQDHFRQSEFAHMAPQYGLELDRDAIGAASAEFRDLCVERCLELAEKATRLAPGVERWWRMRALLQFESTLYLGDRGLEPRTDNWLEVLDAAKQRDLENALYDYLAALQLWNESASYDLDFDVDPDGAWVLSVDDEQTFARGTERFQQAQSKPYLAIGEAGYPAIPEFLGESRLRKFDQADVAVSRMLTSRHATLFLELWRWQGVRANDARLANEHRPAFDLMRQNLHLFEQALEPQETSALNTLATLGTIRVSTYQEMAELLAADPSLLDTDEWVRIHQREEELRIQTEVLNAALQRLQSSSYPPKYRESWTAVFTAVALTITVWLTVVGAVLWLITRFIPQSSDAIPRLGFVRHLIAWTIGCGLSIAVLGMAPAEIISHATQRLAVITFLWLAAIGLTALAVWRTVYVLRTRKFQFRLITLFAIMTGTAVLAALLPLIDASATGIMKGLPDFWMRAKGWSGIDGEILRAILPPTISPWNWASFQWLAHGGPYAAVGMSLILTGTWFLCRRSREFGQPIFIYWSQQPRDRTAKLTRFTGRSALAAAASWLFIYLLLAPTAVRLAAAEFEHKMRYCRYPQLHWMEIQYACTAVERSQQEMNQIRQHVQSELAADAVLAEKP